MWRRDREDRENKGTFFSIELWEIEEQHYKHGSQEHLLFFREKAAPLMDSQTEVYRGRKVF